MQFFSIVGQFFVFVIFFLSVSKFWCSKFMNVKYSVIFIMLIVKQLSLVILFILLLDRLKLFVLEGVKSVFLGQKFMFEKFKLVNVWIVLCFLQFFSLGFSDGGKDDDVFFEFGEMEGFNSGLNSGGLVNSSFKVLFKLVFLKVGSKNFSNKKFLLQLKEKEEKNRDKNKVCIEKLVKEEKDQVIEMVLKKIFKIVSLIFKGSKIIVVKKESLILFFSGILKLGFKVLIVK